MVPLSVLPYQKNNFMRKKLNNILLIDDDPDDNFFHQIIIKKMNMVHNIDVVTDGVKALEYLKRENQVQPELIFLDINMPRMNGWEFLAEYKKADIKSKSKIIIMILTTSANPDDLQKAKEIEEVSGFETKPLSPESLTSILNEYFPDYV
jgi:CheY-like chemotaxis protein